MKKLKLNAEDFKNAGVLSREQLKSVLGGFGGSGGGGCEYVAFCYDSNGEFLGEKTPASCSSSNVTSACSTYEDFDLSRSSCSYSGC